jgi:hypothetical protein
LVAGYGKINCVLGSGLIRFLEANPFFLGDDRCRLKEVSNKGFEILLCCTLLEGYAQFCASFAQACNRDNCHFHFDVLLSDVQAALHLLGGVYKDSASLSFRGRLFATVSEARLFVYTFQLLHNEKDFSQ